MLSKGVGVDDRLSRLDLSHPTSTLISQADTPGNTRSLQKPLSTRRCLESSGLTPRFLSHTTGLVREYSNLFVGIRPDDNIRCRLAVSTIQALAQSLSLLVSTLFGLPASQSASRYRVFRSETVDFIFRHCAGSKRVQSCRLALRTSTAVRNPLSSMPFNLRLSPPQRASPYSSSPQRQPRICRSRSVEECLRRKLLSSSAEKIQRRRLRDRRYGICIGRTTERKTSK